MPRSISTESQREYAELVAFIDFFATHVMEIDPEAPEHPSKVALKLVESIGPSKALAGVRQAVNDAVEMLSRAPVEYVGRLDAALRQNNLLTFSEVRRRYAAAYKRIVKRGRIATETEYYIIAGILADGSSDLEATELAEIERLAAAYQGDAVGTGITPRPPHRSVRAELPHTAPASGVNDQTPRK
jgi:hypothetical protein